jgi:eukaryotic-like serine/threonine-protein kinase
VIGQGSMGEVFFARDNELLRDVAFKRLKRAETDSEPHQKALLREARIAAQLDHPNIVPIHRLQRGEAGELGYVMKLIQGESLTQLLARAAQHKTHGRLSEDERQIERLEVLLKVVDAVAYAHEKGVIHRDLKPDNVLIADHGQVYLTDWGLAKVVKHRGPLATLSTVQIQRGTSAGGSEDTELAGMMGTILYMSPEQANGRTSGLGTESDVFALGLMLYEVLHLKHPYQGATMPEVLAEVRAGKVRNKGALEHADEELLDIAAKATALRPEDRYVDGNAMAADLLRWRRGQPTVAAKNSPAKAFRRLLRSRPDLGLRAVLALLLLDLLVLSYVAFIG